ncbi:MAG TPA: glycosyltransferase family 39 protein [Terriglobales bacterium]|nr:glycosyltransferase family 39 protein [Terriglobales bacterium]
MNHRSRIDWLLLVGFSSFLFFFGLSYFGLVGADEPRYAEVAREMLARRDWITPVLGDKPWLEKPPLYYWQAMVAYRVFGVSDWTSRLPSAVDATLMVITVFWFLRKFRPGLALDGALVTASAAGVIGFARAAATDMPLAAPFTIALLAWYGWYQSGWQRYLAGGYLALALAMLAKGPVAPLLAGVILAVFAWLRRDYRVIQRTLWIPGMLLFCLIALPWYVAVEIKNPEFFRVFMVEHNLSRFATNLYHHQQPFWYFLPVTLLGLVPWTVFAGAALVESIRQPRWWVRSCEMLPAAEALSPFLAVWLIVPVVFFSLSQSKLPGYILPALPAGALLVTEYVERCLAVGHRPGLGLILLHAVLASATVVLGVVYLVFEHRLGRGLGTAIALLWAALLTLGITVTLRSRVGLRGLRFVTLVPVVLALATVLRLDAPILDAKLSARPLATEISRMETRRLPLAVLGVSREVEYGLGFYYGEPIERYESGKIPAAEHLLVAGEGSEPEIAKRVPGRRVSYLGTFVPQRLAYYWVAGEQGK